MKAIARSTLVALMLTGALAASSVPASAQPGYRYADPYYGYGRYYYGGDYYWDRYGYRRCIRYNPYWECDRWYRGRYGYGLPNGYWNGYRWRY